MSPSAGCPVRQDEIRVRSTTKTRPELAQLRRLGSQHDTKKKHRGRWGQPSSRTSACGDERGQAKPPWTQHSSRARHHDQENREARTLPAVLVARPRASAVATGVGALSALAEVAADGSEEWPAFAVSDEHDSRCGVAAGGVPDQQQQRPMHPSDGTAAAMLPRSIVQNDSIAFKPANGLHNRSPGCERSPLTSTPEPRRE